MFIGLTGYMGSGKGAVAEILKKMGFHYISLSDFVRREASIRSVEQTRENLQNLGNDLRNSRGAGVLGFLVREEVLKEPYINWVIDGIRNPSEINELRILPNFHLLAVTANDNVLIKRLTERKRETESNVDERTLAENLAREKGNLELANGQQISKCQSLANYLIINEGTFTDLERKISHFLGIVGGTERPTFDEIFMQIACTWAQRATCLRRKVGAVIAKDSQQLTAGYNGAPKSLPHCADLGGCLRDKLKIPSGQRHELCRGTHAEQNAITQAAKFGINIAGGTLYCNTSPCIICAKMILNAGILKIVYDSDYDDPLSKELLSTQKVMEVVRYEGKKY